MSPDFLPLDRLLVQGRSSGHPVAMLHGQPKTWSDFLLETSAWTSALESQGLKSIALYLTESWDFSCALFAAWSLGLEVSLPGDALPASCEDLRQQVDALIGDFPDALLSTPSGAMPRRPDWPRAAPTRPCLNIYSSGSSGSPRAFSKSFAQLDAELRCLEQSFGDTLGSCGVLSTVSHQHIYGLLFKILWPLCSGRPFLSQTLFFPEEILAAARGFRSAVLISSPAHLKRLPASLAWSAVRAQWSAVFSSGGPLSWAAAQLCGELLGKAPFEIYGSSETGGVAWRQRQAEQDPWKPFSDTKVRLDGEGACLRVRSPKLVVDEWYLTADRARLSGDGFELLGREDRIVKIEEKRVSLSSIEGALTDSGWVREARVLLLSEPRECLGAVLVLSAQGEALGPKALREQLVQALSLRIERVGIPKRWRSVKALPVNALGKSPLADLQKLFEAAP